MTSPAKDTDRSDAGNAENRSTQRSHEIDELRYKMNNAKRGRFIIINNETFAHMSKRNGTDVDSDNLEITFRDVLGFEVEVKKNLTRSEMLRLMIAESNRDHSDCDCFAVAVLTHGEEGMLYGTDELIPIENFVAPIIHCRSLAGKPKLFFIQACRGYKFDDGVEMTIRDDGRDYGGKLVPPSVESTDGGSNPPALPRRKNEVLLPFEADFLYAYSTVPGYYAWRNNERGSWFVQALNNNLRGLASANLDLVRILTRVNRDVAYDFESYSRLKPEQSKKKEVPSIVSMLTKDLYFN